MKPGLLIVLSVIASAAQAQAQDFQHGSHFWFEYPAARTTSGGFAISYPADGRPMLAALATGNRLALYPALSFAVAIEGQMTIHGISYRLYFPRIPPREAAYVFAVARADLPAERTYFEVPRKRYHEFANLFRDFVNEQYVDPRQ